MSRADIIDRAPGHARILGSPRSGKTSLLVERFHYLEQAGHRPLVIAFGRDQRDRLLERLIPPGTARFGPTPVTTHGLLASRLISTSRPNRARTLRDVDERVVLDRVLAAAPDLLRSDLRSIAESRSLRDTLLDVLHLLLQNGVTAAQAQEAASASRDPRASDVLALFAGYRRHLDEHQFATFYDAAWVAAREVDNDRSLATAAGVGDALLVDDFHDLDAGQFELLRSLAPPDGAVSLEVFGDPTGPRFSFRGTSDRFLHEHFPRAYRAAEFHLAPPRCSDAALASALDSLRGQTLPETELAPTPAATDELPLFATAPASHVIPADTQWSVRVHTVCASDEIAEAQHAASCVDSWLRGGMVPTEIAVIARDPDRIASLFHQVFRERGAPLDVGARADTATDAFIHNLVGALGRDVDGRFVEALQESPLFSAFCAVGKSSFRHVDRYLSSLRAGYATRDGFDLARLLHDTMAIFTAGAEVVESVIEDWQRYSELIERSGGSASLDEFRRAYLDAGVRETTGEGIPRLLSARSMSGCTVRAAIVVGCAEGIFPRISTDNSYLQPTSLAAALDGVHPGASQEFAARADRDVLERAENGLLLSAMSAASDELVVSFSARAGSEHLEPAPALAPLFANAVEALRDVSPATRAAHAVAPRPPGDALAVRVRDVDPLSYAWLSAEPAVRHPVLPTCKLSPSGIDNFMRCARRFFYTKVLYMKEPGSIYLDVGNVFHGVMKRVIPEGAGGDDVRALLREGDFTVAVDEAIREEMEDTTGWLQDLTRVHIVRMLRRVVELEAARERSYTVRMVENQLEYKVDGEVVLRGRVDRVDDVEGLGPVVVDYKTGEVKKTAATVIKEIEVDRRHWQVPVYTALASTEGIRPVAFLFYAVPPKDDPHVVGMQTVDGALPAPIPDKGKSRSPYGRLAAATVDNMLEEALALRAALAAGDRDFPRTEDRKECGRCHFIHVCRRSHA